MPKHGGCAQCGSTKDEILTSVPGPFGYGQALCSTCLKKRGEKQ